MFEPNFDWLAKRTEPVLDPDLPLIDAHHHLWNYDSRYLFEEYLADVNTGHRIDASVHVQCGFNYSADYEPLLAPVGETEFVNGVAAMSASGRYGLKRICAGIVGFADLTAGAAVERVLVEHMRASRRFRGIRHLAVWSPDSTIKSVVEFPKGLLLDSTFRDGFACLERFGLSFETWVWHTQIPELVDLARRYPATPVILNHLGTPLDVGIYKGRREHVLREWRAGLVELARCPNAYVKISGLGMHFTGFGFEALPAPPSSEHLALAWRVWFDTCIELFGAERCMFGSNFPVDKMYCSYPILWNTFKRLAGGLSAAERSAVCHDTAKTVYRLATSAAVR